MGERVLETMRLSLRKLDADDAAFIVELLNDPSFLRYVGDKGVRTVAEACQYIADGPVASYERFGFGLYLVAMKDADTPIGICGLVKRESLEDVDVGFALLPRFRSRGYAIEATAAVLADGRERLGLTRIVAITAPDNAASVHLLEKLGFRFERLTRLAEDGPQVRLFASAAHFGGWNMNASDPLLAPIRGADRREVGGVQVDVVRAGDGRVKRVIYSPGFRWSTHMKGVVGTDLCMHAHVGFLARGRIHIQYADGCVLEFAAPQVVAIEPGHDGWVDGDEPAVLIEFDFQGETARKFGMPDVHRHTS